MNRTLITGGRVIDPANGIDRIANVFLEEGRIAGLDLTPQGEFETLDAAGKIVAPGLVDLNVQLREPGCEEDETIETGTRAALAGGFTSIACIPETDPPIDTQAGVEFVRQKAARAKNCRVFVLGCVSRGREGKELAEIGTLHEAGAVGFTDASQPIHGTELLRRALEYCTMFDAPILNHPEVPELARNGVMHEGRVSLTLGLSGMPSDAEDVMIARDVRLCESTGGRLHALSVSCSISIDLLRRAKERGIRMTAGISPWNFAFTEEMLRSFDANWKVRPPLRSAGHLEACLAGLADGTIDVISSGHAPRAAEKKMLEIDRAPYGMSSLETTLPLTVTYLVRTGKLTWLQAIEKLSWNPAKILKLPHGTLTPGAAADVVVIDPEREFTLDPREFRSRSRNTPLAGLKLFGRAEHVFVGGERRAF